MRAEYPSQNPFFSLFLRFVFRNPALAPLFVAVGAGCVGAGWYGFHTLKNNQDVIIDRRGKPQPWQHIRQDQQTKLYTPRENADFWSSRTGLAHPSDVYRSAGEATSAAVSSAKAKVKEIKERTIG
jgi:NADH dehydrogenase (ubiquinone) 1 alpha subcomplex subunit 4